MNKLGEQRNNICLIVPCYNEASRLDLAAFHRSSAKFFHLVFVNDGSSDNTYEHIKKNLAGNWSILNLDENVGKAEAVRRGMLYVQQQEFFENIDWVGYWDADLATPLDEAERFVAYADLFFADVNVIVGSRINRLGCDIKRSVTRHYLGRIFITVIDNIFKLGCYDTQCGAKLFRAGEIGSLFDMPFISRWIFDVEILLRIREKRISNIIEYPLLKWEDVAGSKLVLRRTVFRVVGDILRIRHHYRSKR